MSKRQSSGSAQKNTLFQYFSPSRQTSQTNCAKRGIKSDEDSAEIENKPPQADLSDDEQPILKKRKIKYTITSDSEDETIPSSSKPEQSLKEFAFKKSCLSDKRETPVRSKNNAPVSSPATINEEISRVSPPEGWLHTRLDFLKPEKIRDANRKRPGDPDYNPRTLYVPEDFLNKQTPAMRQWWLLKSKYLDVILFFKVGKFYELYHMDAVIGVNYLSFTYMKGEFAHSGFPESAYGRMALALVNEGFKVARIEQTETPEMMNERCKKIRGGKHDKVVNRELCQIVTKGACTYGMQLQNPTQHGPSYMFALAEKHSTNTACFGVCFIDTSIGTFHIGEFEDDEHCSRLLTLLAENLPSLILLEKGITGSATYDIFKKSFDDVNKELLAPKSEFYDAKATIEKLRQSCYFQNASGECELPPILSRMIDGYEPKKEYQLCLKALGACLWYMQQCKIDIQVFSMKKFELYEPVDYVTKSTSTSSNRAIMVLDSTTIENLKLLGRTGCLQNVLDNCVTSFGKRLLQQWICRPLCDINKLKERQNSIKELHENLELLNSTRALLSKLPDLERQVAKIHTFGSKDYSQLHPDSRAIFYEAKTYSKRKIADFISTLDAFKTCKALPAMFANCESKLLRKLTQVEPNGMLKDLSQILTYFDIAFDRNEAEKNGTIIPELGIDKDYDTAEETISSIKTELDDYLIEQEEYFGCKLCYFGTDKKRYQIEVPDKYVHKAKGGYQLEGSRKGSKPVSRFSTHVTKELFAKLLRAEDERNKIINDLNRRIFEKFSDKRQDWDQVILCLMMLDVLCSLAQYANSMSVDICLPELLPFADNPIIQIENGRYACDLNLESFVPNDTGLGGQHKNILLLTGPNMGGKSTLMRQVALIVLLAQIGSFVPASFCKLNMVDRIFTRLGASDDIIQGKSTFLMELTEASVILQHASRHSLVLIDELGRGTSTHDGNAVATAYLQKLLEKECRGIFSTHYHSLVDFFSSRDDLQQKHMSFMEENDNQEASEQSVAFLFKLADGKCPKSYGFNTARLAGLSKDVIKSAVNIAEKLETNSKNYRSICRLFNTPSVGSAKIILQ